MATIEERITYLEEKINELNGIIDTLQGSRNEEWGTPAQVAEMLHCTVNNIYVKVRKGEIFADRSTGRPRIPMSQFKQPIKFPQEVDKEETEEDIRELVFGKRRKA